MKIVTDQEISGIAARAGRTFRTFGGGQAIRTMRHGPQLLVIEPDASPRDNPIAAALQDEPLQFATGVDVEKVVTYVVDQVEQILAGRKLCP